MDFFLPILIIVGGILACCFVGIGIVLAPKIVAELSQGNFLFFTDKEEMQKLRENKLVQWLSTPFHLLQWCFVFLLATILLLLFFWRPGFPRKIIHIVRWNKFPEENTNN